MAVILLSIIQALISQAKFGLTVLLSSADLGYWSALVRLQ
jgi:hypothetical protein